MNKEETVINYYTLCNGLKNVIRTGWKVWKVKRETKEAIFAYHCDKMECDLQSKLYDEEKCVDMNDQLDNSVYFNSEVQRVMKEGNTSFSSMCMEFDRNKFSDDDNFIKVLEYAKKHKFNH